MIYYVIYSLETVQSSVFMPSMSGPTMTLEEFADLEVERAKEREKNQAEAPVGVRRYE